jgi:hypothetical protein
MINWQIGILVTAASIAMIFFTVRVCKVIFSLDKMLPHWAEQQRLRIVRKETDPFSSGPFPRNRYALDYRVTVEDEEHRQKTGWVRLGSWYIVGFRENVEVRWDD